MRLEPALALLEISSIAVGIRTGDAMAKRSALDTLRAGTVHPGKYLVLAAGAVGDVEEAVVAGLEAAGPRLLDRLLLPAVDPQVVAALAGGRAAHSGEALGVIETSSVAATLAAADAGVKAARVRLLEVHLADGLGGKAYALFAGVVGDVEAAVERGVEAVGDGLLVEQVVIPQLHEEMRDNLVRGGGFLGQVQVGAPHGVAERGGDRAAVRPATRPPVRPVSGPPGRRRRT
jgi:microcompartment protein CcmL/EutN